MEVSSPLSRAGNLRDDAASVLHPRRRGFINRARGLSPTMSVSKGNYAAQTRLKNTIPRNFSAFRRGEPGEMAKRRIDSFVTSCKSLSRAGDRD